MDINQIFTNKNDFSILHQSINEIKNEVSKVVIGQQKFIDQLLVALFSKGHVLIEGVPGVAKTLAAKTISKCIKTNFSRIQFTPDLMPSDVIGTSIFNMSTSLFEFNKGPLFSNIVLIR